MPSRRRSSPVTLMPYVQPFKVLRVFPGITAQTNIRVHSLGDTMATAVTSSGNWDFLYANALLEPNRRRLPERISAAEQAIKERLKELGTRGNPEKDALVDALRALQ